MATVSRGTKAQRFRFIELHCHRYGKRILCKHLNVSPSGYYAWLHRGESIRAQQERDLLLRIRNIYFNSRQTYGSPRVHMALRREGIYVSRKRVERIMRENNLIARATRVYPTAYKIIQHYMAIPNKRIDMEKPTRVNQHWVSDLTYIRHRKHWVYLAVVLDLYSRKVIGWAMGKKKNVELTSRALLSAVKRRNPKPGLIFHTDRGSEYRGLEFQKVNNRYGIIPSMNRPGKCTDNAEMESFFHTLKGDLIKNTIFKTEAHLRNAIAGYIQHFYNKFRLHSSLNYMSPVEYETGEV